MADVSRLAQDVVARQIAMFASFVGERGHTNRKALSAASGIPVSTLKSYADGTAMPLHAVLAIADHLPGAAINMLFEPAGKRLCDAEQQAANWDAVAASASMLTFEICDARSDGMIDHVERARLRQRARAVAAELSNVMDDDS
jgi:hypothetical protein